MYIRKVPAHAFLAAAILCHVGLAAEQETLELTISCAQEYVIGEPVIILATVKNISDTPQDNIVSLEGGWANMYYLGFDVQGPKSHRNRLEYCVGFDGRSRYGDIIVLQPGEVSVGEFTLTSFRAPGRYTVFGRYILHGTVPSGHPLPVVRSDPIHFDVRALSEEDRKVLELMGWKGRSFPQLDGGIFFYTKAGKETLHVDIIKNHPEATLTKYLRFNLARFYSREGRNEEARAALEMLAKPGPTFALTDDALLLLAETCISSDPDRAERALRRIEAEFPKGNCVKRADKMLKKLKKVKEKLKKPAK